MGYPKHNLRFDRQTKKHKPQYDELQPMLRHLLRRYEPEPITLG